MDWVTLLREMAQGAVSSLGAYLAAHVLLCLVPAFFIAGALTALVPKESITRFLGCNAPRSIAYPAAAVAGSALAVCSCTIVPLFAGIYRKGAGIGPAVTFLFFAPAGNILALAYTGAALGGEFAVARVILSLLFGIGIGMLMATLFHRDDAMRAGRGDPDLAGDARMSRPTWWLLGTLIALLLSGTLKVALLTGAPVSLTLPIAGSDRIEQWLFDLAPYDPAKGQEGVTFHGALLIVLLLILAPLAAKGLGPVDTGCSRWTAAALGLVALTLLCAALRLVPGPEHLVVEIPGRFFGVLAAIAFTLYLGRRRFSAYEVQQWLWETWRFVRQIFPILVLGVIAVGLIRPLIRPEWIEAIAGENSALGNVAGVGFGIFMYFPTLVEVPVAKMFLSLGMHPGPLLAYLMADPELSLQSVLMLIAIVGRAKTAAYVGMVAVFSTLAGLAFGAWFDGTSLWLLGSYLLALIAVLAVVLHFVHHRQPTLARVAGRMNH